MPLSKKSDMGHAVSASGEPVSLPLLAAVYVESKDSLNTSIRGNGVAAAAAASRWRGDRKDEAKKLQNMAIAQAIEIRDLSKILEIDLEPCLKNLSLS